MIKELTVKEVAEKLAKEGYFEGYVRGYAGQRWNPAIIKGIYCYKTDCPFIVSRNEYWSNCGIEIPDEYEPYPDDVCPDLKCGDVIVSKKGHPTELMVTMVTREGNAKHIHLFDWKDNKFLFENYTYLDGSPIGRVKGSK